jgi:hypothetical protein
MYLRPHSRIDKNVQCKRQDGWSNGDGDGVMDDVGTDDGEDEAFGKWVLARVSIGKALS